MKRLFRMLMTVLGCSLLSTSCVLMGAEKRLDGENKKTLRIGFFPNLTHVQALVAQAMTHQGNGWLERYLPQGIKVEWRLFNAGPSAMENLITGIIDVSYVGPSPALNLYNRTKGKDCRLLSGAVKGGSGLVLQKNIQINGASDWKEKRIATPQYGNTQDVACRAWFKRQNVENVALLPTSNPDQLTLFKKQQIDGAWTIEPWLSRLVNESGGKIHLTDDESWTTLLVGSVNFCEEFGALKSQLIQAHRELSVWIKSHLDEAATLVQSEMKRQMTLELPINLIKSTLQRIQIETEVTVESLQKWIDNARDIGFLKQENVVPLNGFMQEMAKGSAVISNEKPTNDTKISEKAVTSDAKAIEKITEKAIQKAENVEKVSKPVAESFSKNSEVTSVVKEKS